MKTRFSFRTRLSEAPVRFSALALRYILAVDCAAGPRQSLTAIVNCVAFAACRMLERFGSSVYRIASLYSVDSVIHQCL